MLIALAGALAGCGGSGGVTPAGPILMSISIGPPSATLARGLTRQFAATGIYSDGSKKALMASWSSTAGGIVSISDQSGMATAIGIGSTTINASLGGVTGTATLTVTPATLVSIGVTPANVSLAAGIDQQLTATGVYSDNSTQNLTRSVTWNSSSPAVASIGSGAATAGLASATTPGATTITASLGGVSATAGLTVTAAVLATIEITPASLSIAAGLTHPFLATGILTDNSKQDLTSSVTWASSAPAVASVSNASGSNGLVTTAVAGSTTITATTGGVVGSAALTVTAATLESLNVTPANAKLVANLTQQLQATGIYTDKSAHDLTAQAVWSSSNGQVAAIGNAAGFSGLVTALTPGSVTVTAAVGSTTATTGLTVVAASLASISITPPSATIAGGTVQQFTATGLYTDNSTENLTTSAAWSSAVAAVAGISNAAGENGLVAALTAGTTTITAAVGSVSGSAKLIVSATHLVSIAVTPANSSIAVGSSRQLLATGTFSDGTTQDLTASVTWKALDPTLLSLSNAPGFSGYATAIAAGSTTVSATLDTIAGSTNVTVTAAPLTSIAVNPTAPSLPKGLQQQFAATGTYADGSIEDLTPQVTWSSSVPAVASIGTAPGYQGLATALDTGVTTIEASFGGISGSTSLTVTSAVLVALSVSPSSATLASGGKRQFIATGTFTDDSLENLTTAVTWMTADSSIASVGNAVGSQGLATGNGVGSTSISAALPDIASPAVTLTVSSGPEFAYAANDYDGTVSQYTVGAGGLLTPLGTPTVNAGNEPESVIVDPSGSYAYVVNSGDGTISQYGVGAGGALTALTPSAVTTGNSPQAAIADPCGPYVYAVNTADGTVSQYAIGAGGLLAALSPATVQAGAEPAAVTVDPTGHYVYVANLDGTVSQFTIGSGGALAAMTPAVVSAGGLPQAITVDPTGRFMYVVNSGDNTVSQFAIGAGGALIALSPATVSTGIFPQSIAVDSGGAYAYVANNSDGTVSQYSIGSDGGLTALSPATVVAGNGPQAVSVDLTGRYVYVANEDDDTISTYVIGPGGGLSTTNALANTGSGPNAVTTAY
jgi:6-phosphogluconolactonase (cycloisomerase 2 family)